MNEKEKEHMKWWWDFISHQRTRSKISNIKEASKWPKWQEKNEMKKALKWVKEMKADRP